MSSAPAPASLLPDSKGLTLLVIVETPKGTRNKFDFDPRLGMFRLGSVLPVGASFPFDFGFIPNTLGEDGDPVDVLVLMDEPAFPGCVIRARLIGVIQATQTEGKKEVRNDRLIAVAQKSRLHRRVRSLRNLAPELLDEIEEFFRSYNGMKGDRFRPLGRYGPQRALKLVRRGLETAAEAARNGTAPPMRISPLSHVLVGRASR